MLPVSPNRWLAAGLCVAVVAFSGCQTGRSRQAPLINSRSAIQPVTASVSGQTSDARSDLQTAYADRLTSTGSPDDLGTTGSIQSEDAEASQVQLVGFQETQSRSDSFTNLQISLVQVIESVKQCYPEVDIAIGEIETANGKLLASWGEFDQIFSAHSVSQPLGFYQTYRNGAGLSQPLYGGGEVYGTYRIGDGDFEPWYGERETNEGGEFKAGFSLPLLKNRAIDLRRAKLLAAGLQRDQVESNVQSRLLLFQRFATQAYWDWVAAGQAVRVQEEIFRLAFARVVAIKERVLSGDLAPIAQLGNDQLITKRTNDLIKAQRILDKTAIKLSLFWRDEACQPVIATKEQLPKTFPQSFEISTEQLRTDVASALSQRPELVELNAARQEVDVDLQYGQNLMLPKLDLKGFAGQDIGGAASSKGDKTPFEFQIGVLAEVPLQRREGLGKIQSARGKATQIDAKIRLTSDKIRAEVLDSASAVNAAFAQIQQSRKNVGLTRQVLELGRFSFEAGDIDLIKLNIFEANLADAEMQLLDAQYKYFFYRATYETSIRGQGLE
ncbi:MAG: outer membrane protein TolC [Mariniblastus sp.]